MNDASVRAGAHLRALVDFDTVAVAYWYSAMTHGVRCRVTRGTAFVVRSVTSPLIGVLHAALEDPEVEAGFVGKDGYASPSYAGLSFVFDVSEIGRRLELVLIAAAFVSHL
jgi:hypothetical protein